LQSSLASQDRCWFVHAQLPRRVFDLVAILTGLEGPVLVDQRGVQCGGVAAVAILTGLERPVLADVFPNEVGVVVELVAILTSLARPVLVRCCTTPPPRF
jgi:hypothetical protein